MPASPSSIRIHAPSGSPPLGHDDPGAADLADAGYVQEELLLSGSAAGRPYTTRALLRRPADPSAFSGVVAVEPMHWSGARTVWRASRRHLIRRGHAWAEIASQSSAPARLRSHDPTRYAQVEIVDTDPAGGPGEASIGTDAAAGRSYAEVRRESDAFRVRWERSSAQSPEIIAQFAHALRAGRTPIDAPEQLILSGLSQSGGVVRAFAARHHARFGDAGAVFDGYLPFSSGGEALADLDVPILEVLGESELETHRRAHLLPGQVRGTSHRRADSGRYRLYEVAGMAHVDSRDDPPGPDEPPPAGRRWSRFPNAHVVHFAWETLVNWSAAGIEPPPGTLVHLDPDGDVVTDEHGNARGGLRTAHLDVPVAQVAPVSSGGPGWLRGAEAPFAPTRLRELYGDEDGYRARVAERLRTLVERGYYLTEDAEDYEAGARWDA